MTSASDGIIASKRRIALLSSAAGGFLFAACLALLATLFLLGRTHPLHATRVWLGTFVLIFVATTLWQWVFSVRLSRLPDLRLNRAIPINLSLLLVLATAYAAIDAGVYLFDSFNHEFTAEPGVRSGVAIGTMVVLYLVAQVQEALLSQQPGEALTTALRMPLRRHGESSALLSAAIVGVLVGTSFVTVIGDDYARYWTIADALSSGWGYPASEVGGDYLAGGMTRLLVDLPGLPLMMILSFSLLGHTALAAMLPAIIGSSLFGLFAYLAFRELTENIVLSHIGAVGLTMFPLLSFYVLRSGEPDGVFLTTLMALAFLAMKCDSSPHSRRVWPAMGVVAAFAALTRPEGIAYVGVTFLTLASRHLRTRGLWIAALVSGGMLLPFVAVMLATFGVPWPTSFVGTVRPEHISQNIRGFVVSALPGYSSALGLPASILLGVGAVILAFYALGTVMLARRRPQLLFMALLPAISILMFLLASPALTRPQFPYDFFRRASYGLPYLTLVATYPLALSLRLARDTAMMRPALALLLMVSTGVVAYEAKLQAEPEGIYELQTQILTSGLYILATDLVTYPYDMPRMPFERRANVTMVANSFDYMAFRNGVNGFFKPIDLHGSLRARAYATSALAIFLVGLCYALAAPRKRIPLGPAGN